MTDQPFAFRARSLSEPASRLVAVSPDDATDLPLGTTRGLYVGGPGLLCVLDASGERTDFATPGGLYHPIRIRRVLQATTATDIVALY
jgi:hypothetical protein